MRNSFELEEVGVKKLLTFWINSLNNLDELRGILSTINAQSSNLYQASVTDMVIAARMAKQVKDELNDVSRRLS